jgi:hypothetical protein
VRHQYSQRANQVGRKFQQDVPLAQSFSNQTKRTLLQVSQPTVY